MLLCRNDKNNKQHENKKKIRFFLNWLFQPERRNEDDSCHKQQKNQAYIFSFSYNWIYCIFYAMPKTSSYHQHSSNVAKIAKGLKKVYVFKNLILFFLIQSNKLFWLFVIVCAPAVVFSFFSFFTHIIIISVFVIL